MAPPLPDPGSERPSGVQTLWLEFSTSASLQFSHLCPFMPGCSSGKLLKFQISPLPQVLENRENVLRTEFCCGVVSIIQTLGNNCMYIFIYTHIHCNKFCSAEQQALFASSNVEPSCSTSHAPTPKRCISSVWYHLCPAFL